MNRIQIIYSIALWTILVVIALTIMGQFATRMRNKAKTRKRQQVICQKHKRTFKPEDFISNYKEFIEENTKGMTLFEIKEFKKAVELELVRMIG